MFGMGMRIILVVSIVLGLQNHAKCDDDLIAKAEELEKLADEIDELNEKIKGLPDLRIANINNAPKLSQSIIEAYNRDIKREKIKQRDTWQEFLDWQDKYGFGGPEHDSRYYNRNVDRLAEKYKAAWAASDKRMEVWKTGIKEQPRALRNHINQINEQFDEREAELTALLAEKTNRVAELKQEIERHGGEL